MNGVWVADFSNFEGAAAGWLLSSVGSCVSLAHPFLKVPIAYHHIRSTRARKEDNMADKSTQPRLDIRKVNPGLLDAMLGLEKYVQSSGLEQKLQDLVKIRASQINGCAIVALCTPTMHASTARATSGCTCSMLGARRQSVCVELGDHFSN